MKQVLYLVQNFGKTFLLLSLLIVILSLSLTKGYSATIYIDPSYSGSYQNGTSSNPYNSWTKVTFSSGNTYLQKAGTSTSSGIIAFNDKTNITIGAYGSGPRPKISKSGNGNSIIYLTNTSNITIRDIELTTSGSWVAGIIIQGSASNNNLIENVWIHKMGWGIRLLTSGAGNRVLNCTINDIMDDGIFVSGVRNIEIGYCKIYDINKKYLSNPSESYAAGDGIQINSGNNLSFNIHHNVIDHSSMGNKACFYVWGDNYSGILEHNTFIGSGPKKSNGVFFTNTSNTITVRYNTFRNGNYGIVSYASKIDAYYNIFSNNIVGILINPGFNLTARNNVFFNNSKYGISSSYGTSINLRNNIFNLTSSPAKAIYFMGQVSSNNNVFNKQYPEFINGYHSFSSWKSTGNDNNSVVGNPAFRGPDTNDYHLTSGSVAINRGQNVNLTTDFYGNPVSQSGNPDAGIHEFPGTKTEMINTDTTSIVNDSVLIKAPAVYPNPSSDGLFNISGLQDYDNILIEVFDVSGNKISEVNDSDGQSVVIDIGNQPPGTYIIRLQSGDMSKTIKALKR